MRNAFDTDSGWSRGFSALASALNPDPTKRAQAIYYAQNANRARALAEQTEQETQGRTDLSAVFAGQNPTPGQLYSTAVRAGPAYLGHIPEAQLGYTAATGGDDATLSRLSVGAGKPFQNTPVGVREGHANDVQRSHIAAGPGYARVAEDRRQFQVMPQQAVDPRTGLLTTAPRSEIIAGRYQLPPTQDQVQGNVSQRLTAPGAAPDAVPNWRSVLAPGSVVTSDAATTRELQEPIVVMRGGLRTTIPRRDIKPTDQLVTTSDEPMDQLGAAVAGGQTVAPDVAAGVAALVPPSGRAGGGNPPRVGPNDAKAMQANIAAQLAAQLGGDVPPDVLQTAMARAGARYQQTNNIVSAVDETVREILALKGTTAGGWFSSPQVPGMATLPPVNGVPAVPPPAAPAPPPAPARSVMGIGSPAAAATPAPRLTPAAQALSPQAAAGVRPPPAPGQEVNGWTYVGPPNDPAAAKNRSNWQRVPGNTR